MKQQEKKQFNSLTDRYHVEYNFKNFIQIKDKYLEYYNPINLEEKEGGISRKLIN